MSENFYRILGLAGAAVMLCGAWWRWNQSWRQSDIEEAEKDEKITREEARRRLWWAGQMPAVMVLLGLVLVTVAANNLLRR
jgi:threonine/homoserine/homoserine lactone efflux protein